MTYPEKISKRLKELCYRRPLADVSCVGTGANFECGSFVRYSLAIEDSAIKDISVQTNGCGYMTAAADILAEKLISRQLTDLHGLKNDELIELVYSALGEMSDLRRDCIAACIEAFRSALSAYRIARIDEFSGEKALICTCFGVTEERVEAVIRETSAETVDDVADACNAGSGCGSCRMMIEEMIDGRLR